jgi:hypothetical protein
LTLNSAFGQKINFPDSNAIWSVYNEKYFVDGDSTYNAYNYKKYYFTNDSIVTTGSFFALLRDDTINNKVFSIAAGNTQEHLLYDFSLKLNDTVSVYPISFLFWSGRILVKVDLIDSIFLGSNYHKRLKVSGVYQNTWYDEYWIEGIGSTMGLFNSGITGIVAFDIYYPTLLCFEKDGVTLYSNPYFNDCYEIYPVGITAPDMAFRLTIYPNPTNSSMVIDSDSKIDSYQILSATGKILLKGQVGLKSFTLDISDLPQGIYLVTLKTHKGLLVKKIVKNGL